MMSAGSAMSFGGFVDLAMAHDLLRSHARVAPLIYAFA
jgi:hypothetical protein